MPVPTTGHALIAGVTHDKRRCGYWLAGVNSPYGEPLTRLAPAWNRCKNQRYAALTRRSRTIVHTVSKPVGDAIISCVDS